MKKRFREHEEGWRAIAKKETSAATFAWGDAGAPGIHLLSAFIASAPMPVGVLWYTWAGHELEVLHSYVLPWARRLGVRTALHREMIRGYPDCPGILTGAAAGKASERWLKKQGFRRRRRGWVLKVTR